MSNIENMVAALSFGLEASSSKIQLLPAHDFKAKDGRPGGSMSWKINHSIAQRLIKQVNKQQDNILIDYEHQTLETTKNGQPSPAAGWFKSMEWIEGLGLFATGVEWTAKAKQFIKNKEYRYISPVFSWDKNTGEISTLHHAALVNFPAIDGMKDVFELTAAKHHSSPINQLSQEELNICAATGISTQDYIAIKHTPPDRFTAALKVSPGMAAGEVLICKKLGVNLDDYLATKTNS